MRTICDMRHVIGLALHADAMLYETAIAAEIFGVDRADLSPAGTWYELIACTPDGAPSPSLPPPPPAPPPRGPRTSPGPPPACPPLGVPSPPSRTRPCSRRCARPAT